MRGRDWLVAAGLSLLAGCGGGGGGASTASGVAAAASAAPTLTGRVLGEEGPVAGAWLVVAGPGPDEAAAEGPALDPASLETAADGTFGLALPPGRWTLTAIDPEGRAASGSVEVGAGPVSLELTLAPLPEQHALDLIEKGLPIEASEEAR